MARDIAEFFQFFHDRNGYGPAEHHQIVPAETIERCRGRLPDRLLQYWAAYGWAGYGRGLYWVVDPEAWQPAVDAWLADTPYADEDYYAIGRTAFGDLYLWNDRYGTTVNITPTQGWIMAGETHAGTPETWIDGFIMGRRKDLIDCTDEAGKPLFDRALAALGPLGPDEMYGFEPALVLGGSAELATLQKVNALVHLIILAGFSEKRFMRAEPGRGLIEVDPDESETDGAAPAGDDIEALWDQALAFDRAGRSAEEIAVYDALLDRFGESAEPSTRDYVVKALYNKAVTLGTLDRSDEAIAGYDQLLDRFGAASDMTARDYVIRALNNKGTRLAALGRPAEALQAYDDLLARAAASPPARTASWTGRLGALLGKGGGKALGLDTVEPALHKQVARALVNKGYALNALGRLDEAIASYDLLVAGFGRAEAPVIREQLAKALFGKARNLDKLGRSLEEIAAYDQLVARFAAAVEPPVRDRVIQALYYKGLTLITLRRPREGIAVHDSLVARFGPVADPTAREYVAKSLAMKGTTLHALGDRAAAAAFEELLRRFGDATEAALTEQVAKAKTALAELHGAG